MPPERDPEVAARDRNPAEVALARLLDGDLFKDHVLSKLTYFDVSCLCNVNSGLRIYIKATRPHIGPTMYVPRFVRSLESFEWALANGLTFHKTRHRHRTLAHAVEAGNLDVIKRVMDVFREANLDFRFPIKSGLHFVIGHG